MAFSFQPKLASLDGLVLYVDAANTKSYPGSGTTWTDLSQTAITGSLTNGPTFSSVNGGSLVFDGTNDFVSFGNLGSLPPQGTIQFWMYSTAVENYRNVLTTGPTPATGNTSSNNGIRFEQYSSVSPFGGFNAIIGDGTSGQETLLDYSPTTILTSSLWYNVSLTWNSSSNVVTGHLNGVQRFSSSSKRYPSTMPSFSVGVGYDSSRYFKGNIAQVQIYNRALSATEVLQNYNAICGRFGKTPTITDGDALSFVNAANISNETQQSAINTLVTDLKGAGLWTKMKAIYPFVGGTAASHKWNLKDPRDVDAAFRLTFSGGWTHSSTGALPNGTNGYANTMLNENTTLTSNNSHISIYSRTDVDGLRCDMGVLTDVNTETSLFSKYNNVFYPRIQATNNGISNTTTSIGYFVANRLSSAEIRAFQNNTLKQITNNSVAKSNFNLFIAAHSFGGSPNYYSNREYAFSTIGDGLTDTDATNLYTIVQKYQTTLGRQV